jgi:hypothetical protein
VHPAGAMHTSLLPYTCIHPVRSAHSTVDLPTHFATAVVDLWMSLVGERWYPGIQCLVGFCLPRRRNQTVELCSDVSGVSRGHVSAASQVSRTHTFGRVGTHIAAGDSFDSAYASMLLNEEDVNWKTGVPVG